MNNNELPPLRITNPAVALLEQLLKDAKAGVIDSVAIIAAGPNAIGVQHTGPNIPALQAGTVQLQKTLNDTLFQTARPTIVPARRL